MIQIEESTVNLQTRKPVEIKKNIMKFRRTGRHLKRNPGFVTPDDSLYEFGGWEEEDLFDARVKSRLEGRNFVNLQCFAWKLESLIALAKSQLQVLEAESL